MKPQYLFTLILAVILFAFSTGLAADQPGQPVNARISRLALAGRTSLDSTFDAMPDQSHKSTVVQAGLRLSAEQYLTNDFCRDGLCAAGAWWEWLAVDEESAWSANHLRAIRHVLLDTIHALDSTGLDGRQLLAGYHFRFQPGEHVQGQPQSVALVRHETMEIIVTDKAFSVARGFALYHELGHVVDQRLGRQLSRHFLHEIGGGLDHRHMEAGKVIPDGYWLRQTTSHSGYEATADAFAVWVVETTAASQPVYQTTPADVNYQAIAHTVGGVLASQANQSRITSFTSRFFSSD